MPISRRETLTMIAGASVYLGLPGVLRSQAATAKPIKAVAFDGFPIFDPRPVLGQAKKLYGDQGGAFTIAFRTKLFEYQWLRALGEQYKNFFSVIDDAHIAAARKVGGEATAANRDAMREAFLGLRAWPDVEPTLRQLRGAGIGIAFLSNMTQDMLTKGLENSSLTDMFDHVLSTDTVRTFKPDPKAYQLGVDAFGLPKEQIAFAAFAGWDAAGASWFGYPTVWINRLGFPADELGVKPDAEGRSLETLTTFISARA